MVAQIGALHLALERLHREHQVPVRPHRVESRDGLLVAGLSAVRPVIEQHADLDPSRADLFEGAEEVVGRVVRLQDVELDVHVLLRGADGLGHLIERLLVVGDEVGAVVAGEREGAELLVHLHDRAEPRRGVRTQGAEVQVLAGLRDVLVDLILLASTRPREAGVADHEEQEDADERDEEDGEQPRHRGGGAAVAGDDDDRRDADDDVEHQQEGGDPPCPAIRRHRAPSPPQ